MRRIKYIIIHCSDTEAGKDFHVEDVDRWHKERGWKGVGYHYVIPLDGSCEQGRPLDAIGAHCQDYNKESVGICYIGGRKDGVLADTRTLEQRVTMEVCVKQLLQEYPLAKVCGHHDLNPGKACPCFSVQRWCASIGIPPRNIYHYAE